MVSMLARNVSALRRPHKRATVIAYDCIAMALSLWLAFSIRLSEFYWPENTHILILCIGVVAAGSIALLMMGVYRVIIRYLDLRSATHLALGAAAATSMWFMLAFVSRIEGLPRSVGFIYFGLLFMLMFFGRLWAFHLLIRNGKAAIRSTRNSRRHIDVAICGANMSGQAIAASLCRQPDYRVCFFVDDNPALVGRTMMGLPVKAPRDLRRAAKAGAIDRVLLAMPAATRNKRLEIVSSLSGFSVGVHTMPSHEEVMSGRCTVSDIRPVRVEDLLKRDIVPAQRDLIEPGIAGRSILITGAGGSIGSEICRQVHQYHPGRMVLMDHCEFALYSITAELGEMAARNRGENPPEMIPVVGSIVDGKLVEAALRQHEVDTVFHAAAYKHVPLLETNEIAGVTNNLLGTKALADACVGAGVSSVMMISTDKAVRPTNVMGASKRLAELYIQGLARQIGQKARLGIVRFGNVLDSSGSVVQQFRSQIEHGGPITVTHPDITRFFMSIPEATQLVLQANALALGGEVFVLDMGEPVQILELARTMISLSGMTERSPTNPDGDIEITYCGLRPGEKLYEELFIGDRIQSTAHAQIKMARERAIALSELNPVIDRLSSALGAMDTGKVRALLNEVLAPEQRDASIFNFNGEQPEHHAQATAALIAS